jgi:hypothetical protein
LQIDIDSDESKEHQAILLAARPLLQRHMKQWREIKREEAKNNGPEVLLERDASLFDFWRSCRANFALLSIATFIPVASRYLGIPATSAPSERSFSSSGLAVTKLRNRLGHDLLEHILLCRDWILQPCYSFNDTVKALEDAFADEENDITIKNNLKNDSELRLCLSLISCFFKKLNFRMPDTLRTLIS